MKNVKTTIIAVLALVAAAGFCYWTIEEATKVEFVPRDEYPTTTWADWIARVGREYPLQATDFVWA